MLLAAGVAEVIERAFNLQEEICHSGAECCSRLRPASLRPTRADYLVLNREMQSLTPGQQPDLKHPATAGAVLGLPSVWLQLPSSSHVPKRGLASPNLRMRIVNSAKGSLMFWDSFVQEGCTGSLVLSWQGRWKVDTGTPWFST